MKQETSQIAKDFKNIRINSYKIANIEDTAPATSKVDIEIIFTQQQDVIKILTVYLTYVDKKGNPLVRGTPNGSWVIIPSILRNLL